MFGNLFGSKPKGPSADEKAAFKAAWRDYLIEPSQRDLAMGLESWAWLPPPAGDPIFVTAFGDPFFQDNDGVKMLDTLDGTLIRVAGDLPEMMALLNDPEKQDHWLSSVWIQAARRRGIQLNLGECYDWEVMPALGGATNAESVTKFSFMLKLNLAGQVHGKIRHLPPGTKIDKITIS